MKHSCSCHRRTTWCFQILAAVILGQTLFFKFGGSEESRHIFSALGIEPWGRIGTACLETVAVGLLLFPRTAVWGGILSVGLMSGAILAHLTRLGLEVRDDGGLLFVLAVTVWMSGGLVVWLRRTELPWISRASAPQCSVGIRAT